MRYVFTHIVKTAGTSLAEALDVRFGHDQVRRDNKVPLSDPFMRRNLKAIGSSLRYRAFPEPIVFGHFLTGKYARFNGLRFVPRPDHAYITFLRDPLRRAISHYRYWNRVDGTGNRAWERMQRQNWSLDRFLCSRYFANLQSQFLWNFAIDQFHLVGVTEQYEKSLRVLGERLPLFRDLPALRSNVNPEKENVDEIPPKVRARFQKLNERDYRIYHQAVTWLNAA